MQAKEARETILDNMEATISKPMDELSEFAQRLSDSEPMEYFRILTDFHGDKYIQLKSVVKRQAGGVRHG